MTQHHTTAAPHGALRSEVPSTVALLVDEEDFTAMREYGSFAFDDYASYRSDVETLLKTLAAQGGHITVALFDPEEYVDYCADTGIDPDEPSSRGRYTAEHAAAGASITYAGQPFDELVPLLVDESVRQATWEHAAILLAESGTCADCGQDIGLACLERATQYVGYLLRAAGPGQHQLACSVPAETEQLVSALHADTADVSGAAPRIAERDHLDFITILAAGLALNGSGGLVLRTTTEGNKDRVHGWRLDRGSAVPLSAAAVFSAYCTDAATGEPVAPEPDVEYQAGFPLGFDEHHSH
ncbi:hypothetical protein [Streptomyces goshikiensis]|uniref:hypothetical protein n=1 Tax=Streptomyces goshikiensis TaxID=1942 RepID=UPI00369A44BC